MRQLTINFDVPNRLEELHIRAQTLVKRSNLIYKYYVTLADNEYEKANRRERLMEYAHKQVSKIDRILRKYHEKQNKLYCKNI